MLRSDWLSYYEAICYSPLEKLLAKHTLGSCTLTPRHISRQVATYITDTDFADDLALISDYLEEAQCYAGNLLEDG